MADRGPRFDSFDLRRTVLFQRGGPRLGERLGTSLASPIFARYRTTLAGSVTIARSLLRPPHLLQASTSNPNVRFRSPARAGAGPSGRRSRRSQTDRWRRARRRTEPRPENEAANRHGRLAREDPLRLRVHHRSSATRDRLPPCWACGEGPAVLRDRPRAGKQAKNELTGGGDVAADLVNLGVRRGEHLGQVTLVRFAEAGVDDGARAHRGVLSREGRRSSARSATWRRRGDAGCGSGGGCWERQGAGGELGARDREPRHVGERSIDGRARTTWQHTARCSDRA